MREPSPTRRARFACEPLDPSPIRGATAAQGRFVPRARRRKCERRAVAPVWLFRRLPSRNRNPDHARPAAAIALRRRDRKQRQGVPWRRVAPDKSSAALCRRRAHRACGEARGWRLASPPAREADELITMLTGVLKPGTSVLYLAGRDRKEVIEAALAEKFELEVAETYAAEAREAWRRRKRGIYRICVAALHYSRRSAGLAAALAKTAGVEACFLKLKHVACRATLQSHYRRSAQSASRLPKRLTKRGFFNVARRARRVSFPRVVPYIGPAKTESARRWSTRK